ncbi:MAG: HAMP domain-containing sensor histidine kinase [Pseudomonadota bacterium]
MLIITWLLSCVFVAGWMGAAQSSVGLLMAMPSLIALLIGRPSLVRESAGFAILICIGSLALYAGGINLGPDAGDDALIVPLTIIAIGFSIFLAVLLSQGATAARKHAETEQATIEAQADADRNYRLLNDVPWLMLSVTETGRIISVLGGDAFWWEELAPGQQIQIAFPDLLPSLQNGTVAVTPFGDRVGVRKAKINDGTYSILISEPDAPAPIIEHQATTLGRNDWIAGLGHDLKTPLNAILGFSEIMMSGQFGPLPDRYAKYPDRIYKSGSQLQALIDDIMDVSKAGADQQTLDLEPVDLIALARDVADQLEPLREQADLTFEIVAKMPTIAEADYRAVFRIWQNLASNAIKYSKPGGIVTLASGTKDGMAIIRVIDQGIGMNAEDLDRIAEPFSQGKNSKGKAGTGLGLAVVRTFAELHGGKMVIDTAPGEGTRVDVYLPIYEDVKKAAE